MKKILFLLIIFLLVGCKSIIKPEYIYPTIPDNPAPIDYIPVDDWYKCTKETPCFDGYGVDEDSALSIDSNVGECVSKIKEFEIILENLRNNKGE